MRDINDVFDEENADITEVELDEISADSALDGDTKSDICGDYNFVREQLIKSIVRGSELIDESVRAAKTDSSARQIEAASSAVKTLTEASKSLLDLHEKIRAIEKEKPEETGGSEGEAGQKVVLRATLTDLIKAIDDEDKAQNG
jgi:hypothetical protein